METCCGSFPPAVRRAPSLSTPLLESCDHARKLHHGALLIRPTYQVSWLRWQSPVARAPCRNSLVFGHFHTPGRVGHANGTWGRAQLRFPRRLGKVKAAAVATPLPPRFSDQSVDISLSTGWSGLASRRPNGHP